MASGNMKDIKRRIKSVQSTMQITKAMELVASSKMRHAKERALGARPYFNALYQTITHLAGATRGSESVYTRPREVKNSLYIVIAGDRGLAGGHNANLFKLACLSRATADWQAATTPTCSSSPLPRCRASRRRSSPSAKRRRSITQSVR